jgi:hypothetical protein
MEELFFVRNTPRFLSYVESGFKKGNIWGEQTVRGRENMIEVCHLHI